MNSLVYKNVPSSSAKVKLTLHSSIVVNLSPPLHPSDLAVLRAVKHAMADLPGGSFFASWEFAPGIDPCQIFTGVSCISVQGYSRVNLLSLGPEEAGEPGLWGPLPPELADLPFLQQLSISPGAVSGSIPPGLGSLTYLEGFSCAQNLLTGPIPPTIGALSKLQVLQLSMNRLEGAIPAEISSLQALEFLVLSDNLLSGNIPVLSKNTHLTHLDLRHNELVGELVSFMLPDSLEFLSLSKNQLSGGIGAVGSLSKLNYLDLSFNQFSGAIPSSLFGISGLSYLLLNRNQLSGPLPMTLPLNSDEQLVTIQEVDLSFNLLQGNIPAFLAGVQSLYLNNNLFIGTVPQEFVASLEASTLQSLYLQHNYLSSFGSLATASIPPTVAVCVQYNCQLPPPQSLCPENAGLIARPINECTKFAGTQNLQPPFFP
ncbi:unnamed protein product [Sphagnum jensenii]|uniref:Leucine-rich repeat-containing N-terminal plant-type domain-containing protein n=1 Tax=Sphagnum jensenii TaxID=128206 RepID=A0ABP1AJ48_9BRYO